MKRASYQNGSVVRKERKLGPDTWVYRYKDADGVQKSERIGSVDKYPTKAAATKRAARMRDEINERVNCIKIAGLCDKYKRDELPARLSTSSGYRSYLRRFKDDWGDWRVDDLAKDVMVIENWINGLTTKATENRQSYRTDRPSGKGKPIAGRPARPLSKKTKQHMKAFVHRLFEMAIKWGHLTMQRNPIQLVEVKGKARRVRIMNLITRDQWVKLIEDKELSPHVRVMIFIAMLLGLRASEILGLRWEDIDFARDDLNIRRSHVGKVVDDTKTPESEQELSMHDDLRRVLETWKEEQDPVNGWLFGNITTGRPFWRDSLQVDHLRPAGKRAGIHNLGWHDFRHTYRAMMRDLKISLEEQKTLMRHADIKTTLGYGGKTPAEHGRAANAKVVEMLRKRA
ncbi:MAG TPA: site-specific integrase [Edaphobacter sp.]|nr:site-specific integrase [Edaphobacter sp.]